MSTRLARKGFHFFSLVAGLMSLLLLVVLGMFYVAAFRPHIHAEHVRVSSRTEMLQAEWVAWACGEEARITELVGPDLTTINTAGPLLMAMPRYLPDPEASDAAEPGNRFILNGYRYKLVETNYFTGKRQEKPSRRFDLVGWFVQLPYQKTDADGKIRMVMTPLGGNAHQENAATFVPAKSSC